MKKQHIFYLVVGIAILTIAASALYYFVFFLPEKEGQDFLFSMKQKCQSIGAKLYEEDAKEMGDNNLFVPEYTYNQDLNTCLYAGGHVQKNSLQKWVKDSLSNKDLIWFWEIDDEVITKDRLCDLCVSNEEFNKQKQELFQ